MAVTFFAYLLRCVDGSYYAGHTDDLERRMAEHESGSVPGYTHDRRPVTLVWSETFPSREEALASEKRIQGWSRAKKETLIAGDFGRLRALASRRVLRDEASPGSASPQHDGPLLPS